LIARELEARGISTICMSSAYSITAAVNPPRAVFLDYPLGHTAGRAGDAAGQRRILADTLDALETIDVPGTIRTLDYGWDADDAWKAAERAGRDDFRLERFDTPQYQLDADRRAAEAEIARDGCPSCVFPDGR
jgi:D-proline reductase (dithiol) PrdB